jgi:hypothetical protein
MLVLPLYAWHGQGQLYLYFIDDFVFLFIQVQ